MITKLSESTHLFPEEGIMKHISQADLKKMTLNSAQKVLEARPGHEFFVEPYKHIVIDNFFDKELADLCLETFPKENDPCWERTNDEDIEVKKRTMWKSEMDIPDGMVYAIRLLNSSLFLEAMAKAIGIQKIIPDPYFTGGGLNESLRGGLLDVHVDGNYHDATGLNRRLNAIVYLNPNWKPDWGGEFGIYDKKGEVCIKKIDPLHNRLVIFDSHDFSFHGLPDPINFPEGESRKSIILYYYTKDPRPAEQIRVLEPHSALWKKRGLNDKRGNKTRAYR
jgi:Rps23 Pro-64 3,4-dihydroxylase Tpa1-like proline 4-hydroxylase